MDIDRPIQGIAETIENLIAQKYDTCGRDSISYGGHYGDVSASMYMTDDKDNHYEVLIVERPVWTAEQLDIIERGSEILQERMWGTKYPTTDEWYAVEAEYAQSVSGVDGTDESDTDSYEKYYRAQASFIQILVARFLDGTSDRTKNQYIARS